jgi:antitoxin component YwqK of YwqJK toxin-antitoxin module
MVTECFPRRLHGAALLFALATVTGACVSAVGNVPCPDGRLWVGIDHPDGTAEHWCRTPDGIADGRYERLGPDGQTLVEGWYTNDAADATWYGYDLAGNALWQREWDEGRACGTWIDFTSNDARETIYPDCNKPPDEPDPAPTADFGWDGLACPDGATLTVDAIDVNARFCVVDGRRHGPFGRWFDADLKHKHVNGFYTNDKRDDTWHIWYEDGGVHETGDYVDDARQGHWWSYAPEGWRESEGEYRAGSRHGVWLTFHGNGQRRQKGSYTQGLREGVWQHYYPNGVMEDETT